MFDVTMKSRSAYCLSGENRILDDKNDKQQISLSNFKHDKNPCITACPK